MKKYSLGILVVLLAGLMAGTASAATDKLMTVNVPFAFLVGKSLMPAGEYEVLGSTGAIWIRSWNGANVTNAITFSDQEKKAPDHCALVFTRYGDDYFLSKVLIEGQQNAKVLPKSRREIEHERLAKGGQIGGVQVAANR